MNLEILKLGTFVTDEVTDINGMLTMFNVDLDNNQFYLFQPGKLNPETLEPSDCYWITKSRIIGGQSYVVDLPIHILNTFVTDKATPYCGTAVGLFYHLNGCVHVEIKSKGTIASSGKSIKSIEIDLRRLSGTAITRLSDVELEESKISKPSPEHHPSLRR